MWVLKGALIGGAIGILIAVWHIMEERRERLIAMICFRDEWLMLKMQYLNSPDTFKDLEAEDGLPSALKYWWVRKHYELNDPEEFMNDIRDDMSIFPTVNYDELVNESRLLTKSLREK